MNARSLRFTDPRTVECIEQPVPEPNPDTVVVETVVSAISPGTELLMWRGDTPESVESDGPIEEVASDLSFPTTYGYAAVGTVTAVGENVDETWQGKRVFGYNPHESHFRATPSDLVAVPDGLSLEHASLLANAETAVNFLLDGAPLVGERVAVFGQGVVGLLTTGLLAEMPLESVIAVDPIATRRELASTFGADRVLNPETVDVQKALEGRVDLSYELSGNPVALDDAVGATTFDGTVIVGSWYGTKPVELDLGNRYHRSRISIESSQVSTLAPELGGRWTRDRRRETALRSLGRLPVESMITHRLPVNRANEAYEMLETSPEDAVQILLTYPD